MQLFLLEQVINDLAIQADTNYKKVKEELNKVKNNKGGMNSKQIWSLKKSLCPKSKDLQTGLDSNKMAEHLTDLEKDTNKLCQMRLKLSKLSKTQPWSLEDLQHVLKNLPRNEARDSSGYSNELFSPEVAGDDLQKNLLSLLNMIKDKQEYPAALQNSNITTIHKKKS